MSPEMNRIAALEERVKQLESHVRELTAAIISDHQMLAEHETVFDVARDIVHELPAHG